VSNALRESVTFLNVLSFILLVGNFMNDPTKQAAGFKISSLTRLSMVKDLTNETTLLDLVERSVRNKWSEWESFADDISGVGLARKINVDSLIADAKQYVANVRNVQSSLDSGNLSDPKKFHPEDRVSLVAQRCMRDARRRAEQLGLYLEEMTTTFNDAMTFFGEDPTDENGRRNFFASFAEFLGEWKVRLHTFGRRGSYHSRKRETRTPASRRRAVATRRPSSASSSSNRTAATRRRRRPRRSPARTRRRARPCRAPWTT
jgi:cytokinesis protein